MRPVQRDWLHAAGLRVTRPRLVVLDVLGEGGHLDVATIARQVRSRLGRVSTQAIYDILDAFEGAGLVRRIQPSGSAARYEIRVGDNHHHLVCRECGAVVDVDCVIGQAPCLSPDHTHGYVVDEAEVTFWGRCPNCRNAERTRTSVDYQEVRKESHHG